MGEKYQFTMIAELLMMIIGMRRFGFFYYEILKKNPFFNKKKSLT